MTWIYSRHSLEGVEALDEPEAVAWRQRDSTTLRSTCRVPLMLDASLRSWPSAPVEACLQMTCQRPSPSH